MNHEEPRVNSQDWQGGLADAERFTPEQLELVYERARDTLEALGIPYPRAIHLAEQIRKALLQHA